MALSDQKHTAQPEGKGVDRALLVLFCIIEMGSHRISLLVVVHDHSLGSILSALVGYLVEQRVSLPSYFGNAIRHGCFGFRVVPVCPVVVVAEVGPSDLFVEVVRSGCILYHFLLIFWFLIFGFDREGFLCLPFFLLICTFYLRVRLILIQPLLSTQISPVGFPHKLVQALLGDEDLLLKRQERPDKISPFWELKPNHLFPLHHHPLHLLPLQIKQQPPVRLPDRRVLKELLRPPHGVHIQINLRVLLPLILFNLLHQIDYLRPPCPQLPIIIMRIVYAIIYYYFIAMVIATISTLVFVLKPIRRLTFNFLKNKDLLKNKILNTAFIAIMVLCFVILADSINNTFQYAKNIGEEQLIASDEGKVDYLDLYKKTREYYMAERNFMLTGSALIATWIFRRFVVGFARLNDVENEIASHQKVA